MRLLRRLAHLIFGEDVDRALRPLLAVTFFGSLAGSTTWVFIGIWAVKHLDAGAQGLSVAFLFGAIFFMLSSYTGGHLSDHFGRRPVMLIGWAAGGLYLLGFIVADASVPLGLAYLACYALIGGIGQSVGSALVADLVPPSVTSRPTRRCGSPRTSESPWALRSGASCSSSAGMRCSSAVRCSPRWLS